MRKIISIVLSFGLLFQQSGLVYAVGELNLANYLSQAKSAIVQPDVFQPPMLRYISYDVANNDFKLLLDKGDTLKGLSPLAPKGQGTVPEKEDLFNYFLIGLSLPNDTFWVNLRPDAPENIIDPLLEKTDIGKIFLEADLQLKKDTASLTSPQNPEGKAYWDKLYKKAGELFGTENITIPTITRPWIVPNEVIVRETEDSAYIYKATLKVMLEEDYLRGMKDDPAGASGRGTIDYSFNDQRLKELNEYSSQIIRETIIPKLTKEINSSKRYAQLRQVYYSLVLARWFKQKYGLGSRVSSQQDKIKSYVKLIDSGDLTNLTSQEPCDKQTYFQAYQKSFKDGEYSLKETVATPFGQSIRSYISGGLGMGFEYKAVNSPVVGLKVNSSPVTDILTEQQPPATTASPLEEINKRIKELESNIAESRDRITQIQDDISVNQKNIDDIRSQALSASKFQLSELGKEEWGLQDQNDRNYAAISRIREHISKMSLELLKLREEAAKAAGSPLTVDQLYYKLLITYENEEFFRDGEKAFIDLIDILSQVDKKAELGREESKLIDEILRRIIERHEKALVAHLEPVFVGLYSEIYLKTANYDAEEPAIIEEVLGVIARRLRVNQEQLKYGKVGNHLIPADQQESFLSLNNKFIAVVKNAQERIASQGNSSTASLLTAESEKPAVASQFIIADEVKNRVYKAANYAWDKELLLNSEYKIVLQTADRNPALAAYKLVEFIKTSESELGDAAKDNSASWNIAFGVSPNKEGLEDWLYANVTQDMMRIADVVNKELDEIAVDDKLCDFAESFSEFDLKRAA